MNSTLRFSLATCLAVACLMAAPVFLSAQEALPDGPGRDEFKRACSSCHATSTVTNQRKTLTGWTGTVNDMVTRGAQGSQADIEKVISYLSANFGMDKPAAQQTALASADKIPSLSADEVAKAHDIIRVNNCLSCHRVRGEGSYLGADLGEIGAHRSAEQIRTAIVSPPTMVQPENRGIRIVTKSSQTINGRILNQDALTIQMIDSSGNLRSFKQADLKELTILDQNSMPSYAGKLSAGDLDIVVHYFSSLKEPNIP
jgi:putative heme-binding domain-containing protein